MKAEQGYVHIPMTAGRVDGLLITPTDRHTCARCGQVGGDMALFLASPQPPADPADTTQWASMALHVACLDVLTHYYRTGRKPAGQR